MPLANARLILSREREGAVVKAYAGRHSRIRKKASKYLAADGRRLTQMQNDWFIGVHQRLSAAQPFFSSLPTASGAAQPDASRGHP
jgi:hypothetical protein